MKHELNPEENFLVGIAASAGGLDPMCELLAHAVCHGTMSFVVVSHLARNFHSDLAGILERSSKHEAKQISDGMKIENCRIYTIPPGFYVTLSGPQFILQERPESGPNHSANVFFESLAASYGINSIGVVLSGARVGADGSEGVQKIKARGGRTFAQLPESAEYPAMPELAIETGCIDVISTPEEIGRALSLTAWVY